MRMAEEAAWIRAQVNALVGKRGRSNPYPNEVRRRAVEYFDARRKQKVAPKKISLELGIGIATLRFWTTPKKRAANIESAGFEQLQVISDSIETTNPRFVVRGPANLVIEGLDIESLADLIRRLA